MLLYCTDNINNTRYNQIKINGNPQNVQDENGLQLGLLAGRKITANGTVWPHGHTANIAAIMAIFGFLCINGRNTDQIKAHRIPWVHHCHVDISQNQSFSIQITLTCSSHQYQMNVFLRNKNMKRNEVDYAYFDEEDESGSATSLDLTGILEDRGK